MFKCTKCKNMFKEPPAMTNATGNYCETCREKWREAGKKAMKIKSYNDKQNNVCVWCGKYIIERAQNNGEQCFVCKACDKNRKWLLNCIRYSEKPYKYVSRVEEKEKKMRRKNQIQKINYEMNEKKVEEKLTQQPLPIEKKLVQIDEERLVNMECMLKKLAELWEQ